MTQAKMLGLFPHHCNSRFGVVTQLTEQSDDKGGLVGQEGVERGLWAAFIGGRPVTSLIHWRTSAKEPITRTVQQEGDGEGFYPQVSQVGTELYDDLG